MGQECLKEPNIANQSSFLHVDLFEILFLIFIAWYRFILYSLPLKQDTCM